MAILKARLRRVLDPPVFSAAGTRTDTILDLTEPINGWTIQNATMIMDWTMLGFHEGAVSYTGAIRCTNVMAFWDGYMTSNNTWAAAHQLEGNEYANCQMWPCCAIGGVMTFPIVHVASTVNPTGAVLTPYETTGGLLDPSWAPNGVEWLQLTYGRGASSTAPLKIYTIIHIQLYENDIS